MLPEPLSNQEDDPDIDASRTWRSAGSATPSRS